MSQAESQALAASADGFSATEMVPAANTECEHLRLCLAQLEKELAQARRSLAEAQAERDAYRRSVQAGIRAAFSEAQLRGFAEAEDKVSCKPLDQFIGELEAAARPSNWA